MSNAERAIQRIREVAAKRHEAERARSEAMMELRRYAQDAQAAGVSISQIAREAGLSRQGVYDLLGQPPSPRS